MNATLKVVDDTWGPKVAATRLAELEAIIDRRLHSFFEVGEALVEIHDRKLYRQTHSTFDAYCRDRWDMSCQHALNHVHVSEIRSDLETIVSVLPSRESH